MVGQIIHQYITLVTYFIFLGITCSFIHKGQIKTLPLSFKPTATQTAKDLTELIVECLKTYKMQHKLNSLITDSGIYL